MPSTARLDPRSAGFATTVLVFLLVALQPATPGSAQGLPDLAITGVQVNAACQMVVTMQNQGGPLPAGAAPTLQSYTGTGAAAGGWTMDASKLGPGGTLQWVRQGPLVSGTET
jgi:hypothetical protein